MCGQKKRNSRSPAKRIRNTGERTKATTGGGRRHWTGKMPVPPCGRSQQISVGQAFLPALRTVHGGLPTSRRSRLGTGARPDEPGWIIAAFQPFLSPATAGAQRQRRETAQPGSQDRAVYALLKGGVLCQRAPRMPPSPRTTPPATPGTPHACRSGHLWMQIHPPAAAPPQTVRDACTRCPETARTTGRACSTTDRTRDRPRPLTPDQSRSGLSTGAPRCRPRCARSRPQTAQGGTSRPSGQRVPRVRRP